MLTIIVDSFDGYCDLWPCFFDIFNKQWKDCPYEIKLVSNHKKYNGVDTITVGDEICWSDRTLKAIEQIKTDYVLLLLEDYFLGEKVNNKDIINAISFMKQSHAKYLRLTNIPKGRFHDDKENNYFQLYADEEYGVNLQASIWNKQFLMESLKKYSGNAWEFEIGFLKSAVNSKHIFLNGCYAMHKDPLSIHNGVLKGKWFPKEIRYFSKLGFDIQWKKRGKLSLIQSMKFYVSIGIKNRLTYNSRKKIKKILKKLGVKFVSDL